MGDVSHHRLSKGDVPFIQGKGLHAVAMTSINVALESWSAKPVIYPAI